MPGAGGTRAMNGSLLSLGIGLVRGLLGEQPALLPVKQAVSLITQGAPT